MVWVDGRQKEDPLEQTTARSGWSAPGHRPVR